MINDIGITDDMKAVERWENEGGKVLPLNSRAGQTIGGRVSENEFKTASS